MKQKFRKLSRVRVCDEMPDHMSHFDSGFEAIVEGTYSQLYGGGNIRDYSLYKIDSEGKICNNISWYVESQLTETPNQCSREAEDMIESYNMRGLHE